MLEIKNLTKRFGNKSVLNNISFNVPHGSIAVLLGASGVGKSTLLRVLNNLETAEEGTVVLDGKNIDFHTLHKTNIAGMVFQQFNLFDHLTALENVALPLRVAHGKSVQEAEAIARKLFREYSLEPKMHAYPSQLSGGQKQRLAIVRAIAKEPQVICFDEPTSALDPLLTSYVALMMQKLAAKDFCIVVATHDTSLVEKLDCTVYLLKDGAIIEHATSHDIRERRGSYPAINQFLAGHIDPENAILL